MSAIDVTSARALEDYYKSYQSELNERAFYSFASLDEMTLLQGVKSGTVLTDMVIEKLGKRASSTFRPRANKIKFRPRTLVTKQIDEDLEFNPHIFANTYLDALRKAGQNGKDLPFDSKVFGGIALKLRESIAKATWNAKETDTPSENDDMDLVFDGIHEICKQIRTEAGYAPTPVPTGEFTKDNVLSWYKNAFASLGVEANSEGVVTYVPRSVLTMTLDALIDKYNGVHPYQVLRNKKGLAIGVEMENGMGYIKTYPEKGNSQMVIMTQPGNFVYGTDVIGDYEAFKFQDTIKTIQMTVKFNIGIQARFSAPDYIAISDTN